MLNVTADTNIYISGLNFQGKPYRFLDLARSRRIRLAISGPIIEEVSRVLRDKFNWPERDVAEAQREISKFTEYVDSKQNVDLVREDPADNRILECAIESNPDYIVTGDNDLLRLGKFGNIRILRVADFLDLALAQEPPSHA